MSFRKHCFVGLAFVSINEAVSPPNVASVRSLMLIFFLYYECIRILLLSPLTIQVKKMLCFSDFLIAWCGFLLVYAKQGAPGQCLCYFTDAYYKFFLMLC